MPKTELDITADLISGLLEDQHPDLAHLGLVELAHGWDNVTYRLGTRYTVRLPRRHEAVPLIEHEHLPRALRRVTPSRNRARGP